MARRYPSGTRAVIAQEADDFKLIRGMGPIYTRRLHDAGVLTFAQLGASSPTKISAVVIRVSAKQIARENWIGQARKLASGRARLQPQASEAISEIRQHYATFTVELLLDENNDVRRTRVTHVQTKVEETWVGLAETRLMDFFVRCAGLHVSSLESRPLPKSESPLESPPLLEPDSLRERVPLTLIAEHLPPVKLEGSLSGVLRVSELVMVLLSSDVPQCNVHANEAFNVRLVLDLSEVKKSPSFSLEYAVTIWAKKLGTGARQIVGEERGTFVPVDKMPFSVVATIGTQGTYRLEAIVSLAQQGKGPLPQHMLMAMGPSGPLQVY